ncbi:hypothetical protein PFLUV_G00217940 [Perca fluviatilis]|uniref:Protein kinase domain-containing protein n=1 Tax=Perca fluviatilis TaxID=8168 RepID=A0A6A5DT58_PERFL|nr:hypothetical protein PFLUV_G00217940 [Perca fluviatilis]
MEQFIEDSSLEGWKRIGSGGFGHIYKARHRQWAYDVAIKLLRPDDGSNESLLREIEMMRQATSPYVMAVRGVFKGLPPNATSDLSTQLGVVMDLMKRGSLASLQEALDGPPPWPLVFRLAHQVALGINFLHSLTHPILHKDLKPQNVLLDDSLNAKLTDFGLSRISYSVAQVSRKDDGWGTTNYMPPEAFVLSYKPKRASDIYSYGILLWSILTGKQPYKDAKAAIVEVQVPKGQRPPIDDIKGDAAGLTELKELMKRCWDEIPEERPQALECTTKAEKLYQMHEHAIFDAVYEVLKKLEQKEKEDKGINELFQRTQIAKASESDRFEEEDVVDNIRKGPPPIQEQKEEEDKGMKEQFQRTQIVQDSESDRLEDVDVVGNIRKGNPQIQGRKKGDTSRGPLGDSRTFGS